MIFARRRNSQTDRRKNLGLGVRLRRFLSAAYSFRMGRLTSEMQVNALLTAAKTIQPVLEDFYGTLNYEQKARFNTLDRDLARGASAAGGLKVQNRGH